MANTANVKQILALVMVVLMGIFGNASLQEPTPAMFAQSTVDEAATAKERSVEGVWEMPVADYFASLGYDIEQNDDFSVTLTMVFTENGELAVSAQYIMPDGQFAQVMYGTYSTEHGKLCLIPEGEGDAREFEYRLNGDSLSITRYGVTLNLHRK